MRTPLSRSNIVTKISCVIVSIRDACLANSLSRKVVYMAVYGDPNQLRQAANQLQKLAAESAAMGESARKLHSALDYRVKGKQNVDSILVNAVGEYKKAAGTLEDASRKLKAIAAELDRLNGN